MSKNENDSTINTNATSNSITYQNNDLFELIFLEQILRDVRESHNRCLAIYDRIVHSTMSRVTSEFLLSESLVQRLVPIKDSSEQFEMQVGSSLDCVTELLTNDEEMLGLLLTEGKKAQGKGEFLEKSLYENAELLLEEYVRQLKNVQHEVQEKEVDFLFGISDKNKDGLVHIADFQLLKQFPEKKPYY